MEALSCQKRWIEIRYDKNRKNAQVRLLTFKVDILLLSDNFEILSKSYTIKSKKLDLLTGTFKVFSQYPHLLS